MSIILERFMDRFPIPVMIRALLERVLNADRLNALFILVTQKQYTRELLFSSIFELMSLVVLKTSSSVHAAYQSCEADIAVSITSVYNKLNGIETEVPAALVHETSREFADIIEQMNGACEPLLPGYRVKMLDGNCLAGTQHRLKVLRDKTAGALPGKSLVMYDPALEMAIDVLPCEDGHTQERSLLERIEQRVQAGDVIVADRSFCVRRHLFNITRKGGHFVCRYHKQMPCRTLNEPVPVGETETGTVVEQWAEVTGEDGDTARWRCITVKLIKASRDGDKELVILTDLPESAADALQISNLYRKRWRIETMFQELESHLQSEINTLGYPRAALFGFCVALVAYNVMAVVKAALRSVHDEETIRNDVSSFYVAWEISRTQNAMTTMVDPEEWSVFQTMTHQTFIHVLLELAQNVKLKKYKKHRRGPKKAPTPRVSDGKNHHVSTARLLRAEKGTP